MVCGDAGRDSGYVDRIEMQADQEGTMMNVSDLCTEIPEVLE